MTAGQIKSAGPLHFRTASKTDPFRSNFGPAGHRHPRRDPEPQKHENPGGKETADEKAAREKAEADAAEKAKKEKDAADAKTANDTAAAEKKRADDAEAELERIKLENASDEEKRTAATVKEKVAEAVSKKEVELTDHYETIISGLQDEIITATIDNALIPSGRTKKDFATVIETTDMRKFVGDDGKVKKDAVEKWAKELAGSTSTKPPRTSTGSASTDDRGFGKYLEPAK